ncbi:MAG: Ppx/GppA family phosphatase [Armatimonadetes bacterium]|nr:Ppx/GppA family phosphatase [Armatimonadota bacterium]
MTEPIPPSPRRTRAADNNILAALDIGTNSLRMVLVRLHPATGTWDTLSVHKETVRLGQGEFSEEESHLTPEAIERGVFVLKQFVQVARGRGAGEIVAIGTAALREAANRDEFLARARTEAGVEVQVVPGVEEARLIYLGVASGIELGDAKALFIDIGGGSTELIVGTQTEHLFLDSLKLGAIRLGNRFLSGVTEAISPALWAQMSHHVEGVAAHALRKIERVGFDTAVASSGTAQNLARVSAMRQGTDLTSLHNYVLPVSDLRDTVAFLCDLTLDERRKVPGLNPERADIIISGAAVLLTLADELHLERFVIAERSLREGVLVDAILRRLARAGEKSPPDLAFEAGIRRRSVDRLARLNPDEITHSQHVAFLSLRLFDDARNAGLHSYGDAERELLEYAALLHDVGVSVSHSGHHRHSYYLVRHSDAMSGFTDEEIEIIANLAYFHRKSSPKKRHTHFAMLSAESQNKVRHCAVFLRLAEGLDRSHLSAVRDVSLGVQEGGSAATLHVLPAEGGDAHLEQWYVANDTSAWEEAWGTPLNVVAG